MHPVIPRASRWPLALSLALVAAIIAALGACADEPAAPTTSPAARAQASAQSLGQVITVTNTSGGFEPGSLEWAVASMVSGGGTVRFDPSLAGDTITLRAELYIDFPTVIEGPADKGITLSGGDQHRVIWAEQGVTLKNVTVTQGNLAYASAIYSGGPLRLEHSTVQDNRGSGAAIWVARTGADIVNSTISRNVVGTSALRYRNGATVQLHNSTIAYNSPGAGLSMEDESSPTPATVVLNNSIVSNNGSPLQNCVTTLGFVYEGTNVVNDWSCGTLGVTVADPLLLPLARNGGPTTTHAIDYRSPALNKGQSCTETVDQRYVARDSKCDVGAFEFTDFTKVAITINSAVKADATGKALLTGTIKCTRADAFRLALELHQDQKVGRQVVDVHAASDIPVSCGTTATSWSANMGLAPGEAFQAGAARATAQTFATPEWVTSANAAGGVKISIPRR